MYNAPCRRYTRPARGRSAVALLIAVGLGAHQPDRGLFVAHQTRNGQIIAPTAPFQALTCDILRFLRGPLVDKIMTRLYQPHGPAFPRLNRAAVA
jgi:hypothetical protein